MIHSTTGLVHTLAALLAVLTGAIVFLRPKSGPVHRCLGYIYVLSMVTVIVSSFAIYRLTGRFNFLHGAAIVSAITVSLGFKYALLRKPSGVWQMKHFYWMSWSFIGLLAALMAETATRIGMPLVAAKLGRSYLTGFWCMVGLVTFVVVLIGRHLVAKHTPSAAPRTSGSQSREAV